MVSKLGLYAYGLVGKSPKQLNPFDKLRVNGERSRIINPFDKTSTMSSVESLRINGERSRIINILGIDKKNKVYPIEGRDICVMVSKIDTDKFQDEIKKLLSKLTKTPGAVPSETEEILRRHEDVLDTLMKLTAVVPFKFGTILKDKKAASKMLQDYGEKFKKLLSKFTGREEWGLKVYTDNQEFKKHLVQIEPKFSAKGGSASGGKNLEVKRDTSRYPSGYRREKLSRGAAYLLGRKMEEELKDDIADRLAKVSEIIFQEAGKNAYEAKLNKTLPQKLTGKKKEMILNTAYLVEKEKATHFCKQVKKIIEKYKPMGLEIELSGPWPPYSFT